MELYRHFGALLALKNHFAQTLFIFDQNCSSHPFAHYFKPLYFSHTQSPFSTQTEEIRHAIQHINAQSAFVFSVQKDPVSRYLLTRSRASVRVQIQGNREKNRLCNVHFKTASPDCFTETYDPILRTIGCNPSDQLHISISQKSRQELREQLTALGINLKKPFGLLDTNSLQAIFSPKLLDQLYTELKKLDVQWVYPHTTSPHVPGDWAREAPVIKSSQKAALVQLSKCVVCAESELFFLAQLLQKPLACIVEHTYRNELPSERKKLFSTASNSLFSDLTSYIRSTL